MKTDASSMLAEAIHSLVDIANEGFSLLGIHRSQRPPDDSHPFGYGAEVYFWSFVGKTCQARFPFPA